MKLDRIIWGIILLFVGAILLLENFGVIDFYWRNIWQFWPIGLILLGLNIIFGSSDSKLGSSLMILVVVLSLGTLFVIGQESPRRYFDTDSRWNSGRNRNVDKIDNMEKSFFVPYSVSDSIAEVNLSINGEGSKYTIKDSAQQMFNAFVTGDSRNIAFMLKEEREMDSVMNIRFSAKSKSKVDYFSNDSHEVDYSLNTLPVWNISVNVGAGDVDFDLRDFKVKRLKLNGGAMQLKLIMGDRYPESRLELNSGASNLEIEIPQGSACQIISKTALANREFPGFKKTDKDTFETENFQNAKNKIYIRMNGALSNFEVKRY